MFLDILFWVAFLFNQVPISQHYVIERYHSVNDGNLIEKEREIIVNIRDTQE